MAGFDSVITMPRTLSFNEFQIQHIVIEDLGLLISLENCIWIAVGALHASGKKNWQSVTIRTGYAELIWSHI